MNLQLISLLQQSIDCMQNGKLSEAENLVNRVLIIDNKNFDALHISGVIKGLLNKPAEGILALQSASKIQPNNPFVQFNLAKALMENGRSRDSIKHHERVTELSPNNPDGWVNYGKALRDLGKFEKSLFSYEKALAIDSNDFQAWSNRGVTLNELKRLDEALTSYEKAIAINPNYYEAWSNRGVTLNELKRLDEALTSYEKAIAINPNIGFIYGSYLHLKMNMCNWRSFDADLAKVSSMVSQSVEVSPPLELLSLCDCPSLHLLNTAHYVDKKFPIAFSLPPIPQRPINEKIRLGYFSADFRNHAVSHLIAGLLECHDRDNFEVIAFSFGPQPDDPMRLRVKNICDQFIDISTLSDVAATQLARDQKIDIAIDLTGHTQYGRMGIFANRAAPIQINYLGYPGSSGAPYIDYIIGDHLLIPTEAQKFYSEKIIYLPCFQANDDRRVISDQQFLRSDFGINENAFVYCSFNNTYKINPNTFNAWMRILKSTDNSVLLLLSDNGISSLNLKNMAVESGINPERLIFLPRIAYDLHLARYGLCDLFLDTLPYNGGTTASDALWSGLPVLTQTGESFASRMAASLLNSLELPELITTSQKEYEHLAIHLYYHSSELRLIKEKLRRNRTSKPLFDPKFFAKKIEGAFYAAVNRYAAKLPPHNIDIS